MKRRQDESHFSFYSSCLKLPSAVTFNAPEVAQTISALNVAAQVKLRLVRVEFSALNGFFYATFSDCKRDG